MYKTTLRAAFAVLFMAIGLVSCDTEPVDPLLVGEDPTETGPASFEVDFSGDTYQTETAAAVISNGVITLTATRSDGASFVIMVQGTTAGTYPTAYMSYQPSLTSNGIYSNISASGITGSVHITSINATTHKITGTFNFTGYWTDTAANLPAIPFTNGIFSNIAYTGDDVVDPTDAVFKVDYDGATFTADDYYASVGYYITTIFGYRGTNGEYVAFSIYGNTVGTYTGGEVAIEYFSGGEGSGNEYGFINDESIDNPATSVTVTIDEVDTVNHTISGTFSFIGEGSGTGTGGFANGTIKEFTNGEFTVPYVTTDTETPLATATVDNVFYNYSVDIEGSDNYTGEDPFGVKVFGPDHKIEIRTDASQGVGSYPISDDPESLNTASFWDSNNVEYHISEGTITLTSVGDYTATGTFSFVVKNEAGEVIHTVTGGTYTSDY